MSAMPRPRPPYLHRVRTRHGKFVWYVRRGADDRQRIRIRAEFGTPEFQAEYEAALTTTKPRPKKKTVTPSGSIAWLYERYRETSAWTSLSVATRRQRENIFHHVIRLSGTQNFREINRKSIEAAKDARRDTPAQARNFLDAMRGLFRWALAGNYVKADPTAAVKNPARPDTGGFPAWTEGDVDLYEARWPRGSRERVWFHVLLYTGLRRGDAVRLGRQHVRDGIATIWTEKTGIEVSIPLLPVLQDTIAAGPCGDLAFICGERGQPLTKESFGNKFSAACRKAGLRGKSCHGVRKITATRCAENGATTHELMAIMGWSNPQMAEIYTRGADRRRLAKSASGKMARNVK